MTTNAAGPARLAAGPGASSTGGWFGTIRSVAAATAVSAVGSASPGGDGPTEGECALVRPPDAHGPRDRDTRRLRLADRRPPAFAWLAIPPEHRDRLLTSTLGFGGTSGIVDSEVCQSLVRAWSPPLHDHARRATCRLRVLEYPIGRFHHLLRCPGIQERSRRDARVLGASSPGRHQQGDRRDLRSGHRRNHRIGAGHLRSLQHRRGHRHVPRPELH